MALRARTSITHPLLIAAVSAGDGMGAVGLTLCPGKVQSGAVSGIWERDLALDLDAVAAWGAVAVVTLIEPSEIEDLSVQTLGEEVAKRHMEWLHLPIRDVSVPGGGFELAWTEVSEGLRARLRAGFNILVHCKGGLGRAGMIACRLLIELGTPPAVALAKVREVRPGAVETKAQEAYVLDLKPVVESRATDGAEVINRGLGALLGLATGDAVGTTLEFTQRDATPPLVDMVGGGPFKLVAGEWTDDTAMALALADSLVCDRRLDARDLMDRFVSWSDAGTYSCTGRCFNIGITTRVALRRYLRSGDAFAGSTDPQSAGNGSLMRLAPVTLAHWRDRALLADVAARQSRTTHAAPEAIDACMLYADILADAISGKPRSEVLRVRDWTGESAVARIAAGSWRGKPRGAVRSSGYVIHSLEAALWCVARTTDYRSAILLAANLGDDADTTAAITGQLAGALYGMSGIPTEWLAKLVWRERLEAVGRTLLA